MLQNSSVHAPVAGKTPAVAASLEERLAFLKKVYGLLTISLVTAFAAVFMTLSSPAFLAVVANNMLLFFVLEIGALLFAMFAKRNESLALIALFTFVILSGVTVSPIIFVYSDVATQAAVLTLLMFGGLTAYAFTSRRDFSKMGPFLFIGLIVLIVSGLLNAFVFQSTVMQFIYAAGGTLLFSGFILYDTSNIMRRYSTDQAIMATLALYLDILNLFMMLLQLLGLSRD